jgi:hypothetical protein
VLSKRFAGDVPPEALPRVDEALVAQDLERPADGHAADAELRRQLALAGQDLAHADGCDAGAQVTGDLLVADGPHRARFLLDDSSLWLGITCIIVVYIHRERKRRGLE